MLKAIVLSITLSLLFSGNMYGDESSVEKSLPKGGEPGWQGPKEKTFTQSEINKTCRSFNGKYISYYSKVYKVENCLRRELDEEAIEGISRRAQVLTVENDIIIMLASGDPITSSPPLKNCRELSRQYIISPSGEMYLMEDCKLRLFPDFESYEEHAKKLRRKDVLELNAEEFGMFKLGSPMETVLDEDYRREPVVETEVDVIPLSEACRGLNGHFVSYYSKLYKIENCRKREVKDHSSLKGLLKKRKVNELSSEQWFSLPDGKAF